MILRVVKTAGETPSDAIVTIWLRGKAALMTFVGPSRAVLTLGVGRCGGVMRVSGDCQDFCRGVGAGDEEVRICDQVQF
jgi:hypothetical protein